MKNTLFLMLTLCGVALAAPAPNSLLAAAGTTQIAAQAATPDCCQPDAACCQPGAACCEEKTVNDSDNDAGCCEPGAACCQPGADCCK